MDNAINTSWEIDEAIAYNCPNCGAELKFNADKQRLCCEFCESEFTIIEIAKTNARENAAKKAENASSYCEMMNEYSCPNCGAEITADESTAADT